MGNLLGTEKKKLIIMRGLPGSGKTTRAKELKGRNGVILSSDDYFTEDGVYKFVPAKLKDSHLWNIERAIDSMKTGLTPVIIDNVNGKNWEPKKYAEAAVEYGYFVSFEEPRTEWRYDPVECSKRDTHGVPIHIIERMYNDWEKNMTVESILNSKAPWEK